MAIYAMADLHLACSIDKPMDIFGAGWSDYMDRIKEQWTKTVKTDDTVVIPGDISWATYLDEAYEDFAFVEALPGTKIILKGNHDYWWTTSSKLNKYIEEKGFKTIRFLQNNCYEAENFVICGSRGWKCPGDNDFNEEDKKIYERELQRLELSLRSASKLLADDPDRKILAALHFPPFNPALETSGFVDIMSRYPVKYCVYGHLHGDSCKGAFTGRMQNVTYEIVSSDCLGFKPQIIE